jgi:hypothetical protein
MNQSHRPSIITITINHRSRYGLDVAYRSACRLL